MNLVMAISCFALLVLILALLGYWQRRISENEDLRVLSDIREARETGTDKPLAQHPQIDVQACIGCGNCIAACPEEDVLGLVDGVAHVIHGSRCIGHARCAVACPVAAIQVGLGELAKSPNLPILSPSFETSLPGVHVAGELGGFALIRIAVEQGTRAVEAIARDLVAEGKRAGKGALDLLIVGAGPAGLAASLKAKELGLRYLTIDQDDVGGTVRKYPRRKLTLTGPLEMPLYGRVEREEFLKEELIEFWQGLIDHYQLKIETGIRLEGLDQGPEAYRVRTSARPIQARRVILALGRRGTPRKLGVPGEETEKVLYHLVDAATYRGMRLLVVGGGDSAIEAATALGSQPGNAVTLSYRREAFFRIKARNAERIHQFQREGKVRVVFGSQVERIDADAVSLKVNEGGLERAELLPNDFVLVCAGGEPPFALLRGLGVQFNGDGATGDASGADSQKPVRVAAGSEGLS